MYSKYAELRDKAGKSDSDVSRETGITPSTFSDWKAGRYEPKVAKLIKIASVLGVGLSDLLREED